MKSQEEQTCNYCWQKPYFICHNCKAKICEVHMTKLNGQWYCDYRCYEGDLK